MPGKRGCSEAGACRRTTAGWRRTDRWTSSTPPSGWRGRWSPPGFGDGLLQAIQRDLFTIGAELATPDPGKLRKALASSGAPVGASNVATLEDAIDTHEAKLAPLKNFILPGGTPTAAALHLAS